MNYKVCIFLFCSALLLACGDRQAQSYESFGEQITREDATDLATLTEALLQADSVETKLTGTIDQVCQMKGCWMTLKTEDGSSVRVTFKDYGFFVPKDVGGKEVIIQGTATRRELDRATAEHYAEDAGKSLDENASLTELSIVASGVLIRKAQL